MDKTLEIINQMQDENLFVQYAIGGAIASLFYIEPVVTFDLDIFILLPPKEALSIITLTPIYEWLKRKGYKPHQEQVMIEGIPVQFLPAYNDLIIEAVEKAEIKKYQSVHTRVIGPEYLMAIMLQTYRQKDKERLKLFISSNRFSINILNEILIRYDLMSRYEETAK